MKFTMITTRLMLLVVFAVVVASAEAIDAEKTIDEARRLAAARMTVKALEALDPLLSGEHEAKALAEAGRIRFAAGDWSGAADHFRRLLNLHPEKVSVRTSLLVALEKSRRDDEARQLLEQFGVEVEKHARMLAVRGLLEAREGRLEVALDDLRAATQLDQKDMFAPFELGVLLLTEGDPDEAVPFLEEADRRQPETVGILYNLGVARLRAGDRVGGREAMNRSTDIADALNEMYERKSRAVALAYRAKDRFDRGDAAGAIEDLENAISLSPDDQGIRRFHDQLVAAVGRN